MDLQTVMYNDKLALELLREGKRPVPGEGEVQGLLFINTKDTGSTKIAIRPKSGDFTLGLQENQNTSASINNKTKYLLFCENIPAKEPMVYDPTITSTNNTVLNGKFLIERNNQLNLKEFVADKVLNELDLDPNLVVVYNHTAIEGKSSQVIKFNSTIAGATNAYYIELDGKHINAKGQNLISSLLTYEYSSKLLIEPNIPTGIQELLGKNSLLIENRDSNLHTLYIRYSGTDATIKAKHSLTNPIITSLEPQGYTVDPDGLGVLITFAACNTAHVFLQMGQQVYISGAVIGNRYVLEVNGVQYRDTRPLTEINSPVATLETLVSLHVELANTLRVVSSEGVQKFTNLSKGALAIKVYLDETVPFYVNDKTVDTGDNPSGIYKKLDYAYGSVLETDGIRNAYTTYGSVPISVTNGGISFILGPNTEADTGAT